MVELVTFTSYRGLVRLVYLAYLAWLSLFTRQLLALNKLLLVLWST